ncbi:hypothetical protein HHI36_023821 [Cryptolaemus montrouzieri]|uniref:Uncharacterized protein n=1 Tax=Cryptolaemus montrouzieri TaxID=559131 RepID=A0ABD2PLK0_9CUCU
MDELTKIICGQSLSSEVILTKGIYEGLDMEDNSPIIQNIMKQYLNGIRRRWPDLVKPQTLLVATFLDPRSKNGGFSSGSACDRAKTPLTNLVLSEINETEKYNDLLPTDCKKN